MKYRTEGVTVRNWSRNPTLGLGRGSRQNLKAAIRAARQMVDDAIEYIREYRQYLLFVSMGALDFSVDYCSRTKVDTARDALTRYFGSDFSGMATGQLDIVLEKLRNTRMGLAGQFDLVVGYIHDMDDIEEAIGDMWTHFRRGHVNELTGDLKFAFTGTEGWVSDHGNGVQGRIHLNKDTIKTESAGKIARVIVHEATHKWAQTIDVAYKWDGLKHNAGGHLNLIRNADSYAWAARRIWKKKRGLPAGS